MNANVLILGESGTGKEAAAWAIHDLSNRRTRPFLSLNCSGFEADKLEAELFGYVKGAFTGASASSEGIVAEAAGGTLFLDEFPDLDARVQAKLLRFLQSGEYRPLGGKANLRADVRIIAAGQPARMQDSTHVRSDLIYRVAQLELELKPLCELEKEAPGTILKISGTLLERMTWEPGRNAGNEMVAKLTPDDIRKLKEKLTKSATLVQGHAYRQNNVRELQKVLTHWLAFGDSELPRMLKAPRPESLAAETLAVNGCAILHEELQPFFAPVSKLEDLDNFFEKVNLKKLLPAYLANLFETYKGIIQTPSQKDFAVRTGIDPVKLSRELGKIEN